MKLALGRIGSILLVAGSWLVGGFKLVLDLIGYSTIPEDVTVAQTRLDQFLVLVLSIPWQAVWGFALISTLWLMWVSWPRTEKTANISAPSSKQTALAQALAAPIIPRPKPKPIFGRPRQLAAEPFLSWWYVPITVDGIGGSPNAEIKHCMIELFDPSSEREPINLRWKADDDARGKEDAVLVEGMYRYVPLAQRCEQITSDMHADHYDVADGFARITGAAFLKDGNTEKFKLDNGRIKFKLRVRSGKKSWESPHFYTLNIPKPEHSNGHFILCIAD